MHAVLAVAALLAGCGGESLSPLMELTSARARWDAARPASYTLTLHYMCGECLSDMGRPVIVTVTNGVIESRVFEDDGTTVDPDLAPAWKDVDGLFDEVTRGFQQKYRRLTVRYHPTWGYPESIFYDVSERLVDDEGGYSVMAFAAR